jgi:hypothetical protein
MVAVLIAIFLCATLGLLSQALSDLLVLLLHHRTTWSRLDSGTLLGAGTLGTRSLGIGSNATGEDNRRCREYEDIVSHLNLLDEATLRWGCPKTALLLCADEGRQSA